MTHLPDCDDYAFSGAGYHPNCERICICRQVRRIEQRVLDAARKAVVNCDDYYSGANMLLVDAYREGLQAAREAIDALRDKP